MNPRPLVSAIVPLFNGEAYLGEALASISAQNYRPIEIIVVDDGSSDRGYEIAQSYGGVRCFRQERGGVAVARNRGVTEAQGEYLAFLDQDDKWTPDKLEIQVDYLRSHRELGYVFAHQRLFLEPGSPPPVWIRQELVDRPHPGFCPGTILIDREFFRKVGFFNPAYRFTSDGDWFFRAQDLSPRVFLPEVLLLKRSHRENESNHYSSMQSEMHRVMLERIKRKRSAGG
ncbi:MAG TPA: glycosyltransferase family A protein [bacterium]|nr:glycosyltransferase family A protein [bacterium]